jgi:hypothetical protein
LGTPEQCADFFARFDPAARVVADPEASFYGLFGLERAGAGQLLSPAVFGAGLRALLKGNLVGKPSGDVMRMPGAFLVRDHVIEWSFVARHVGDHPDLNEVARVAIAAASRPSG